MGMGTDVGVRTGKVNCCGWGRDVNEHCGDGDKLLSLCSSLTTRSAIN